MEADKLTEELIHALNHSQEGFKTFKTMFDDCANYFEIGEDAKGLEIIGSLIEPLQGFCNFCADMICTHSHMIDKDNLDLLKKQCEQLESLIGELVKEMEDGNYVEVGDILKYDVGELTTQMSGSFPKLARSINNYEVSGNC